MIRRDQFDFMGTWPARTFRQNTLLTVLEYGWAGNDKRAANRQCLPCAAASDNAAHPSTPLVRPTGNWNDVAGTRNAIISIFARPVASACRLKTKCRCPGRAALPCRQAGLGMHLVRKMAGVLIFLLIFLVFPKKSRRSNTPPAVSSDRVVLDESDFFLLSSLQSNGARDGNLHRHGRGHAAQNLDRIGPGRGRRYVETDRSTGAEKLVTNRGDVAQRIEEVDRRE